MNISCSPRNFLRFINIILLLFLIVIIYIIISSKKSTNSEPGIACIKRRETIIPSPSVVKIHGIQPDDKKLDVVKNIFLKLGYEVIFNDTKSWDVLWSHTYPFYCLKEIMMNLKSYQKVNHFPGSGYLTQKNNLAALPITHIPKSFLLPANKVAFLNYAEDNNNMFWIIKNSNHRGIKIYTGQENLDVEGTFVQEFIKDPLLISGKKFDIGVYVVLASIDPLRVYVYNSDILLRFCKENYFPLNINSVDSYVVGDDYLPIWEVPALSYYYTDLNYTAKESLNAYIHSKGKNSKTLWLQIYQIILNVFFMVEDDLKKSAMAFGNVRNFFELVRFDFIVDEYINVYLLEVNMSPNLSPAHFPQNELLYEQIVFNTFQLIGLVKKFRDVYRGEAEVSDRDIQINAEQCSSKVCEDSCENTKCKLCNQCMNKELRDIFKSSYREFMNKGKFKKIIPIPTAKMGNKDLKKPNHLSLMNTYMDSWFKGKCLQDSSWCH